MLYLVENLFFIIFFNFELDVLIENKNDFLSI